jgi:hypothetical protein
VQPSRRSGTTLRFDELKIDEQQSRVVGLFSEIYSDSAIPDPASSFKDVIDRNDVVVIR